eukprot:TRINITY_DN134_c0_g2_i1.p1 TRINITY_DN134_c0_g2~~TRINITY_DN134_c0_g2_i1.p1  ORF type:complete len:197 (-),score=87.06 TRINITY_DN134_c0_g2_i1:1520-2110(-)
MPKISLFDLVSKLLFVILAICIVGLASAGISYAQLEYAQDLFIAILVLTLLALVALVFFCFFVEPSSQKYDLSKAEKGKQNGAYESGNGSDDIPPKGPVDSSSKLDNVKWTSNYVPYTEDEKSNKSNSKKEETATGVSVEEEKKDAAEKSGESWKNNYVPYEEDSEVDASKALSKPRELIEDSNKQLEEASEKEDK